LGCRENASLASATEGISRRGVKLDRDQSWRQVHQITCLREEKKNVLPRGSGTTRIDSKTMTLANEEDKHRFFQREEKGRRMKEIGKRGDILLSDLGKSSIF